MVSGQLRNKLRHLNELTGEPAIWARDTGQWLFCFDSCQLTILWMSSTKDVERFAKTRLRHPPFLLRVSPSPPVQSADSYLCTYVRMLGQSRDKQTKRGWPYSMSPAKKIPEILVGDFRSVRRVRVVYHLPTPRQNVYACARLSISGHLFSHTFQSDHSLPRALASFCVQPVVQLFCFMLLVFLTIL